jgi:hypothetical protein
MMPVAEMLCAWFAGIVLGWRLGLVHRRTNDELRYWNVANTGRPPFDWADEPEQREVSG